MECVHRRKGKLKNSHGHLYIFNKCVSFYSKEFKPPIILHYDRVAAIKKSGKIADRIKGKIKVVIDDGSSYGFKRLKNRDQTHEQIVELMSSFGKLSKISLVSSVSSVPESSSNTTKIVEEEKKGSEESSEDNENMIQEEEKYQHE